MEERQARTFVGYHGTSILSVPSLLRGVVTQAGGTFAGKRQLGIGFYTTADYATAVEFAEAAVTTVGGYPAVAYVYVRDFDQLNGREIEPNLWWNIADESPYITDYDYLTSSVFGYEAIHQRKFNPRAYHALVIAVPR